MERRARHTRGTTSNATAVKSELEANLAQLRNQRAQLLVEIQGMGNGTVERTAGLASKKRRLKIIDRQIARVEVALLAL